MIGKEYRPFLILLGTALIIHMFLPLNWGDDAVFLVKSDGVSLLRFLKGSARPLTDTLTYVFSRWKILWRVLNPFVLTGLAVTLSRLMDTKNEVRKNRILCCGVIYPGMIVVDAGFIATTVNYLWPVTFGLMCLLPLKKLCRGEKETGYKQLLLIPCLVYACSMQQMCAVLIFVFFGAFLYLWKNKKRKAYIFLQFIITSACLFGSLKLNMSGDNSRMLRETARYFPDFQTLNIFQKAELGFSSTFYCMTMETRFAWAAFLTFSLFLAVSVFKKRKQFASRLIGMFPFLFSFVFGLASLIPEQYAPFLKGVTGGLKHFRMTHAVYSFEIVPDILFVWTAICVLYGLYVLIEDRGRLLTCFLLLLLGLGSRMLMGFSPTIWASGYRTFFLLFIAFLCVGIFIMDGGKQNEQVSG